MTTTPADPGAIVQMDGLPCACRFRTVEGAIRHGSETGELIDPDTPIRECDLHKALQERVTELEVFTGHLRASRDHAVQANEAEAARVAELAEVLEDCAELVNLWASKAGCQTEDAALKSDAEDFGSLSALRRARTVLAATPAEALERARGEDYAAGLEAAVKRVAAMGPGQPTGGGDWDEWSLEDIIEAIRALGKEGT